MAKIELPPRKKVRHLTLLRESRAITPQEFNALAFEERMEMVRVAHGRQKYDLILDARDAERLVQRLPAQEVYILIKELGSEDVPELLALASTEQFTAFLDLDCWKEDILDGEACLRWLQPLLDGDDEERVLRMALELDLELLALMMQKWVTVTFGPEDYGDDEEMQAALAGSGGYQLEYRDSESAKLVGGFLELLFRRVPEFYGRLLQGVRWEMTSPLEETVYRFRAGRLLDRGFPDPFESLAIYSYFAPESFEADRCRKVAVEPGERGVEAPGFVLTAASPRDLLAEIVAGGVGPEICWELTYLINKAMSADRVDVGDVSQVEAGAGTVYRYLNIALEHLSGGDLGKAQDLFDGVGLEYLFRLGFSLTLDLQQRSRKVRRSALGPYLDGPFRALVAGLDRKKPQFFSGIEDESRGGERPFANLSDLSRAGQWLDRLEVQQRLFEERFPFELPVPEALCLEGCLPDAGEDVALSEIFLTALANRILGRDFLPTPIPEEEIAALHARACAGGKVVEDLRRETVQWLDSLEPGSGAFGAYCLDLWEEEFCSLRPDQLDPRYVGGIIVRLGPA
ncbi:MAG: hypothetical protein C0617_00865 [Desulfuromonas sp.]|uniref:DUF6178 family protein n=1 Tax=Desulfuromonas sp. TaxID=892 RepID=UPI000CAB62D1|nr:DUF6178 family protein [Desulfuromonas sp.]PLX86496.1 MAG: hypothetical protein C0617_00865 [Desulfuromonas sp.]